MGRSKPSRPAGGRSFAERQGYADRLDEHTPVVVDAVEGPKYLARLNLIGRARSLTPSGYFPGAESYRVIDGDPTAISRVLHELVDSERQRRSNVSYFRAVEAPRRPLSDEVQATLEAFMIERAEARLGQLSVNSSGFIPSQDRIERYEALAIIERGDNPLSPQA